MIKFASAWYWQAVIVFTIFVASSAGYYAGSSYTDYMNLGYVTDTLDQGGNPLIVLGTFGSAFCALALILYPPKRIPDMILATLPVQLWLV